MSLRAELHTYAVAKGCNGKKMNQTRMTVRPEFLEASCLSGSGRIGGQTIARAGKSLNLMLESNALQRGLADQDLVSLLSPRGGLLMVHLEKLNPARQRNVIRRWAKRLGLQTLGWRITHQLVDEFLSASESGSSFDITDCLLYRHDGELLLSAKE